MEHSKVIAFEGFRWFDVVGICEIHAGAVFNFPVLAPVGLVCENNDNLEDVRIKA